MLTHKFIMGVIVAGLVMGFSFAAAYAEEQSPEFYPEVGQVITVAGELSKIKMTNFPDNPWEETILTTDKQEKYILIGKLTEEINKLLDKKNVVTVTGTLSPKMVVKGEYVKVIDLSSIDKILPITGTEEIPSAAPEKTQP